MSFFLPIYGMHCQNCVDKVQAALNTLPEIETAIADLDHNRLTLTGDNLPMARVKQLILDLGYQLEPDGLPEPGHDVLIPENIPDEHSETQVVISISGMSCASCVRVVEMALRETQGVVTANVNFADSSAFVVTRGDPERLVEAVSQSGYGAGLRDALDDIEGREAALRTNFISALTRSSVSLGLGLILMSNMYFDFLPDVESRVFWATACLLVLGVMIYSGGAFFRGAVTAARHFSTTMDTLIAIGTGAAWSYSMLVVVMPAWIPESSHHLYLEAVLFIIGFINLGKAFELNARNKTSIAIRKLLSLQPETALRISDGREETVPVASLIPGDRLRLPPGAAVPVDGRVINGLSSIDESMLTGESIPADKQPGDRLVGGTINLTGSLVMEVLKVGRDTVLSSIISLVREAQNSKPRIGRTVDKIAAIFVPMVLFTAFLTALSWLIFGPVSELSYVIMTTLSVLVIACPCALGLAIPMSIMVGMGRIAGEGVLIRDSESLQTASKLTTVVMDKTGTLTTGKHEVTRVWSDIDLRQQLSIATSLERLTEHPLAQSIVAYCSALQIEEYQVENFEIAPGGGVLAWLDGTKVAVGNLVCLNSLGMELPQGAAQDTGDNTVVYVGRGSQIVGGIELTDQPRTSALEAVQRLETMGVKVVMLTGDNERSAVKITNQLGIDEYHAALQPEDKLDYIRACQDRGERVGMVGDGINDALALSVADVGFAMGKGTDIAVGSADVVLLGADLTDVAKCMHLSKRVLRNIHQNLVAAFTYNIVLIPVAAGVLYPAFGLLIDPMFAGLAMVASSATVVGNAGRLRLVRYPQRG